MKFKKCKVCKQKCYIADDKSVCSTCSMQGYQLKTEPKSAAHPLDARVISSTFTPGEGYKELKKISDYLPTAVKKRTLQALVTVESYNEVRRILDEQELTWHEFIQACLNKYLSEYSEGKK